ncbi:MAG: twin-arginine translocase TatA/TatE family subunit [Candidatus Nanopelagicales bacterium]
MLDIGLGELLLIAVLALLVFGPDRLPKVASDAARMLRQVRQLSAQARSSLVDAAGIADEDGDLRAVVREVRDLDPRRAVRALDEQDAAATRAVPPAAARQSAPVTRSSTPDSGAPATVADPDWT